MSTAGMNGECLCPNGCWMRGVAKLGCGGGVRRVGSHFVGGVHVPPGHLFTVFMTDGWVNNINCKKKKDKLLHMLLGLQEVSLLFDADAGRGRTGQKGQKLGLNGANMSVIGKRGNFCKHDENMEEKPTR